MKQLTNYQRVSNYLVKVFKGINEEYFNNELEVPTITIQSSVGTYGHITVNKVWHTNDTATHELNLSADYLNRPIEDIVATLIHEACHLYCIQNNIKDTSNRGVYHNTRFKKVAEQIGHLYIEKHDKYGWTLTYPTEDTLNFIISYGFEDIELVRGSYFPLAGIGGAKAGNGGMVPPKTRKPSSTRKYICPGCGSSFRATKALNVKCMDCDEQFILAD
jgi:DNA-directed RNA polymerase subunit RPC12/RpoP